MHGILKEILFIDVGYRLFLNNYEVYSDSLSLCGFAEHKIIEMSA